LVEIELLFTTMNKHVTYFAQKLKLKDFELILYSELWYTLS